MQRLSAGPREIDRLGIRTYGNRLARASMRSSIARNRNACTVGVRARTSPRTHTREQRVASATKCMRTGVAGVWVVPWAGEPVSQPPPCPRGLARTRLCAAEIGSINVAGIRPYVNRTPRRAWLFRGFDREVAPHTLCQRIQIIEYLLSGFIPPRIARRGLG